MLKILSISPFAAETAVDRRPYQPRRGVSIRPCPLYTPESGSEALLALEKRVLERVQRVGKRERERDIYIYIRAQ